MSFKNSTLNGWAEAFWDPSFWLLKNMTWDDFNDTPDVTYPKYYEVGYPIVFSVFIFLLRYLVERFVFIPIGISKGLKANNKPMVPIPLIEDVLKKNSKDILRDRKQIIGLAKQLDWSERQVERWIRRREKQKKHSELDKFAECGWKVCYYSISTLIGIAYLFNKPWFWDTRECWTNYPHQHLSISIKMIYLYQSSYYWSLLVSQFFDVRRKDFWGLFIHHLAAISLLTLSYTINVVRLGILTQVLHDCSDIFLEAAKCFKYIKWGRSCDLSFVLFVLVWIVTRLIIFPVYIIKNPWQEGHRLFPDPPSSLKLGALFLVILFLLHIMWTYYIGKVVHRILFHGKREDSRSSCSEISDESSMQENSKNVNK